MTATPVPIAFSSDTGHTSFNGGNGVYGTIRDAGGTTYDIGSLLLGGSVEPIGNFTTLTTVTSAVTGDGAASTPPNKTTGAWFTGGSATTTKPQVLIEATGATTTGWSTSGTGLGINAATGFVGNLLDLQLNGTSAFKVTSAGAMTAGGAVIHASTTALQGVTTISGATGQCFVLNSTDATNGSFMLIRNSSSSIGSIGAAVGAAGVGAITDIAINASAGGLYLYGGSQRAMLATTVTGAARIGFYSTTPAIQPATTGTATGFTAGSGTAVKDDSTFTGGSGSTAYRISDIVLALKQLGLMAA